MPTTRLCGVCADLYGHGLSAAPQYSFWRKRYSGDFFVAQARELLEHLNLHTVKVAVLGFSMGACVDTAAPRAASFEQSNFFLQVSRFSAQRPSYRQAPSVCLSLQEE